MNSSKLTSLIVVLVIALIGIAVVNPVVVIGAGQRGVVFNQTTGLQDTVLGEGMHFRTPFVQTVKKISVRIQSTSTNLTAGSSDNQTVTFNTTLTWHINPNEVQKFYQEVGEEDKTKIDHLVDVRAQEAVKTAAASFAAEDALTKQAEIKKLAFSILSPDLAKYHLILDDVTLNDIDFTAQYNKAIEDKAQAKQQAEQAYYLKQKAQNQADAELITASGAAKANKLLEQTLTPELLQKMAIEKWDGHYPQTVAGGGTVPLINLGR